MRNDFLKYFLIFIAGGGMGILAATFYFNQVMMTKDLSIEGRGAVGMAPIAGSVPLQAPPVPTSVMPTMPRVQFGNLDSKLSLGPQDAPVTLVEFSDFHCYFCKTVAPTLQELVKNNSGKVRLVFKHFPLPMHPGAEKTHEASECAAEQGKFWEFHNLIFQSQERLRDPGFLEETAQKAGLNQKAFEACLASGKYHEKVIQDALEGDQVGVNGTPAVFINGKKISGARPYAFFDQAIQNELKQSQT